MAHSPARALDVGSVIAGTYTIEGLLGKGGMGADLTGQREAA